MFNNLPHWLVILNGFAMGVGYVVLLFVLIYILRPMLRGLSYGLYETVMYYKGGADLGRVFTRFLRALTLDLLTLGDINSNTQSVSNNMCSWYGIFGWHFKAEFNRKASKIYNAEQRNKPAPVETETVADDDDFGV
jgi:hypothetical protein